MIEFHGEFKMDSSDKILKRIGLNEGGEVQKYIDSEVLRLCDPYLPFQTGTLRNQGILGTVIGSGEVAWVSVKARYLYYGKVMVGPAPKTVTDKDLTYNGAPMRGKLWFERMKADRGQEIIDGVQKMINGGSPNE